MTELEIEPEFSSRKYKTLRTYNRFYGDTMVCISEKKQRCPFVGEGYVVSAESKEGIFLGYVLGTYSKTYGPFVGYITVAREYRRMGIGRDLIRQLCLLFMRKHGAKKVKTTKILKKAKPFWNSLGLVYTPNDLFGGYIDIKTTKFPSRYFSFHNVQ